MKIVRRKPWWQSKRVHSALLTFWAAVFAVLQAAAARCADDAGIGDVLRSVTPSEWVLLMGACSTAVFTIWFGQDSVSRPSERNVR